MADSKLSALPAKTTLVGTEETYINDGGTSKKATLTSVNTYVGLTYQAKTATVTPVTTTASLTLANTGTVYTNEGDTNGATVTLPTASAGLQFTLIVQAAQTLTITASAGDSIRMHSSATATAGSITSATIGSSITLLAINATEWIAISAIGVWTI